jgi:hypothetical protein
MFAYNEFVYKKILKKDDSQSQIREIGDNKTASNEVRLYIS